MTLPEVAEVLAMSVASARRLVASGRLPLVRLNRRILVDVRDLDKLIEQAKHQSVW